MMCFCCVYIYNFVALSRGDHHIHTRKNSRKSADTHTHTLNNKHTTDSWTVITCGLGISSTIIFQLHGISSFHVLTTHDSYPMKEVPLIFLGRKGDGWLGRPGAAFRQVILDKGQSPENLLQRIHQCLGWFFLFDERHPEKFHPKKHSSIFVGCFVFGLVVFFLLGGGGGGVRICFCSNNKHVYKYR